MKQSKFVALKFFFVIPGDQHSACTIPTWPLSGGGDPWHIIVTWRQGMGGDGLQTYPLQGCVRSYAIVCSLPGFEPTTSTS